MKKLLFVFVLFLSFKSKASHILGGWIEAEVINSTLLKVRVKMLASCFGIGAGTNQTIQVSSIPTGSAPVFLTPYSLSLSNTIFTNSFCNNGISACNGGTNVDFKILVYEGFVPVIGNSVRLSIPPFCCRAQSVNIPSSANYSAYTDVYLINTVQNSSPKKNTYDLFSKLLDSNTVSFAFIDDQADSLVYQLSQPIEGTNPIVNVPLNAGYTVQQPFGTSQFTQLNSNTGHLKFVNSNAAGIYSIGFDLKEYRNGQLLSKIHGEHQIIADSGPLNSLYFSVTGDLNKTFKPCQSDTVNYVVNFNLNDSIVINVDSLPQYSGAVLNVVNVNPTQKKVQFIWQPPYSAISLAMRPMVFEITKYACPYKKTLEYITKYKVDACPIDSVWPGDINLDKTVNLIDAVYLAAAFNATGSPRINPSINWTPQFANNWVNNFSSAGNYKHADCDGDGTVQINDALAIVQNFNLVHAKQAQSFNNNKIASTIYDPTVNFGTASFTGTGANVMVPISIGDATKKVLGANAILFKVNVNPAVIDANSLQFIPNTGIITNLNDIVITQYKAVNSGDLYIAFVKKNNGSFSGFGNLGQFNFQIKSNAALGNTSLSLGQTTLYGPNMLPQPIKPGAVKVLNVVLNSEFLALNNQVNVFPNPFKNKFSITSEKVITKYEVIDMSGKVISMHQNPAQNFEVTLENLEKGLYFLNLHSNVGKTVIKLVKE